MLAITKYKSNDGKIFDTAEEAKSYEDFCRQADSCALLIIKNGNGNKPEGIENSQENIDEFMKEFRRLLTLYDTKLLDKWDANPRGIIGRYLLDGRGSPMYMKIGSVYHHGIMCVGGDNKSYGQPYFATNKQELGES